MITDLLQQAFIASLIAGRSEAVQLARQLPDSQAAQLLLGEVEVRAGHWQAAEQQFQALPRQGLTQLLQPLLVAWAQQGDGRTDAALATLRPLLDGQRFRGVYALHAALIADQAGRTADAAKLYHHAQTEFGSTNLRLAQILASWAGAPRPARRGAARPRRDGRRRTGDGHRPAGADRRHHDRRPCRARSTASPRPISPSRRPCAQQDAGDFAMLLLRLALDLRPDFTAARVLAADILDEPSTISRTPCRCWPRSRNDDPLSPVIRLQRAALTERLGHTDEAHARIAARSPTTIPTARSPPCARATCCATSSASPRRSPPMTAPSRGSRRPPPTDWLVYYDRGICYERSHQWTKAEADFKHALTLVARSALRAELSRLSPGPTWART